MISGRCCKWIILSCVVSAPDVYMGTVRMMSYADLFGKHRYLRVKSIKLYLQSQILQRV